MENHLAQHCFTVGTQVLAKSVLGYSLLSIISIYFVLSTEAENTQVKKCLKYGP